MAKGDFNKTHPELRKGEVFLTNISQELDSFRIGEGFINELEEISWRTKRLGITGYDIDGNPVRGVIPVFVQRKELRKAGINPDSLWK